MVVSLLFRGSLSLCTLSDAHPDPARGWCAGGKDRAEEGQELSQVDRWKCEKRHLQFKGKKLN